MVIQSVREGSECNPYPIKEPHCTKSPAIANAKLFRLNFVVMPEIRALAVLPVKLQKPVKSYIQQATFG
jgi:hypothetical protein